MVTSRFRRGLLGRLRRQAWVDPVGYDPITGRVHDVQAQPGGQLLHHSTCWCRP